MHIITVWMWQPTWAYLIVYMIPCGPERTLAPQTPCWCIISCSFQSMQILAYHYLFFLQPCSYSQELEEDTGTSMCEEDSIPFGTSPRGGQRYDAEQIFSSDASNGSGGSFKRRPPQVVRQRVVNETEASDYMTSKDPWFTWASTCILSVWCLRHLVSSHCLDTIVRVQASDSLLGARKAVFSIVHSPIATAAQTDQEMNHASQRNKNTNNVTITHSYTS